MRDIMFEIPSRDNVAKVTVNKKTVVDGVEPEVELTNEQAS
jgi:ATP-dependent Clp protease ATP-binding subunit ClpX